MLDGRARTTAVTLAFLAAVAALALVFRGGVSSNPASRVLGVLALVENHGLRADAWHDLSIDRALVDGHFYSDKAPLSSFLVAPFFLVWRLFARGPITQAHIEAAVAIGDVVVAALPFAAFTALLRSHAARWASESDAVWMALLGAFGTSVFAYAGVYMGHLLAGTLFLFAYHFATSDPDRRAYLCGLLGGLTVLTEYPMLIAVAILGVFFAARGVRPAIRYALGGLPCGAAMLTYNAAITGSPFDPPYRHAAAQFMAPWGRAFALDAQMLHAARMLVFSEYRGLLVYAPALVLLAPLALLRAAPMARRVLLVSLVCAQFVFVASFFLWDGGWAIGPRHLIPVIMVLVYEGVGAVAQTPGAQLPFVGLASVGVALNLLATATNPFVEGFDHPFRDLYWPAFARGEITPYNLFALLGLHLGRASVLAWCALFVATGVTFARLPTKRAARA